mmetsp:Transcript_37769/g.52443  ORF Transcript_37769/g.52443 Transcript_37769/m.52443 type:complete len:292 (-) Transcript_37769:275-1150(-)
MVMVTFAVVVITVGVVLLMLVLLGVRVLLLLLQELGVDLIHHPLQVKPANSHHKVSGHFRVNTSSDDRHGIDLLDPCLQGRQLCFVHQVCLVQHDTISKRNLLHCFVHSTLLIGHLRLLIQVHGDMLGVHHCYHAVNLVGLSELLFQEERLDYGGRVGKPRGLDEHVVKVLSSSLDEFSQHLHQVSTHRAADAPVVQHHDVLIAFLLCRHQRAVDVDLAKLVFNDSDAQSVVVAEDTVQQSCLTRPEKSCNDRYRDTVIRRKQRLIICLNCQVFIINVFLCFSSTRNRLLA